MKKSILTTLSLCIAFSSSVSGCNIRNSNPEPLQIVGVDVMAYENYSVEDINREIGEKDNDAYTLFVEDGKVFNADMEPYYKFWIDIKTNIPFDDYCSGESQFMIKDLGKNSDHWIYLLNPFTTFSTECAMGFYQGNLSDDEVKKALCDVEFVYVYKDKDGKNCDYVFRIDESTEIDYEDYSTF